jgi:hypothetical protein
MAGATVLTVNNMEHVHFVPTSLEFKSKVGMTDLASETNPMKPMRKNYWTHAGFIRKVVNHYIAIFSPGQGRKKYQTGY